LNKFCGERIADHSCSEDCDFHKVLTLRFVFLV